MNDEEGFKVSYATDGSVALAEIRREAPDVIILDLMLPGMGGLEVYCAGTGFAPAE